MHEFRLHHTTFETCSTSQCYHENGLDPTNLSVAHDIECHIRVMQVTFQMAVQAMTMTIPDKFHSRLEALMITNYNIMK